MKADLFQKDCEFFYSVTDIGKHPKTNLPEIAFLGRSNVGKSSVINALVNRKKLVRTSNTPGSTIKINYFKLAERLMLVDLPGHGYAKRAKHLVEDLGHLIKDYLINRANLKKLIFITDARRGIKTEDEVLLDFLNNIGISVILVVNKIDKLNKTEITKLDIEIQHNLNKFKFIESMVNVSCTKGYGIKKLRECIVSNI
ncbi:ribosome biogenesis GTP-binding protein YihA/YsxC [Candidatus Bandiella euplotis]|uniref:Probable GTP-binding protein EngB n=1 Tax=Candidatus Bandiella euplotis TaxID=1664265 RepID=A0ABZ0UM85_9RICK|nr:ribosome biogenesis GTP-binding protein YihA/YsxC [Candidatus Bandiella woodruffii]WPX96832.1 putative GTP-binding protein EngB [Candidatus Bandiella woodruffii]